MARAAAPLACPLPKARQNVGSPPDSGDSVGTGSPTGEVTSGSSPGERVAVGDEKVGAGVVNHAGLGVPPHGGFPAYRCPP